MPRSPCGWRYETSRATRPARERHSRPSRSPSASPRRSSSSRRPRRRSQPASRPTCPTGRSACTPVRRRIRGHPDPDARRARTYGRPRPPTRGRSRRRGGDPAPERLPTRRAVASLRGVRVLRFSKIDSAPARSTTQFSTLDRRSPLRRHACPAQAPRNRPRDCRSEHGLPGRLRASDRRARHSRHQADGAVQNTICCPVTNVQRIDSREYLGGNTDGLAPASFITLDGLRRRGWRQIPSGLARRVEPASDERADRRCPRLRGRRRPDDRDTARAPPPSRRSSPSPPPLAPSSRLRSSP